MNRSTQTLPDDYKLAFSIDLATQKTMAMVLNLVGVGAAFFTIWLLSIISIRIHPELSGTFSGGTFTLSGFLLLVLIFPFTMFVHEIIHGIFFWIFTRSKPVYALTLTYAYAAAPDWYIPNRKYWMISLAPLFLIGMAGIKVMVLCPPAFVLPTVVAVGINTGGAIGDIWVVSRSFRFPTSCLVKDTGHGVYFYQPGRPDNK